MGRDDHAPAPRQLKRAVQLGVVDAERSLVGQKDFERSRSVVDDAAELAFRRVDEARHAHVEGIIASRLSGRLRFPQLIRLQRVIGPAGTNHFDERRRAAHQRGAAGRGIRVLGVGAHERQVNVYVRIDEAGEHVLARGVDRLQPWLSRHIQIPLNARNRLIAAVDIGDVVVRGGNDSAVGDEQGHGGRS